MTPNPELFDPASPRTSVQLIIAEFWAAWNLNNPEPDQWGNHVSLHQAETLAKFGRSSNAGRREWSRREGKCTCGIAVRGDGGHVESAVGNAPTVPAGYRSGYI